VDRELRADPGPEQPGGAAHPAGARLATGQVISPRAQRGIDPARQLERALEIIVVVEAAAAAVLAPLVLVQLIRHARHEIAELLFQHGIEREPGRRAIMRVGARFEVRQCVDNDGPGGAPGTLLDCATVQRRDQGCGRSFLIAERG
jgi:hypothetical protein